MNKSLHSSIHEIQSNKCCLIHVYLLFFWGGVAYSRGAYLIFDCFRGALIRERALIRINTLNKQRIFSLFQDY